MAAEFTEIFPYRFVFGQALTMKGSDGEISYLTLTAPRLPAGVYECFGSVVADFQQDTDALLWRASGAVNCELITFQSTAYSVTRDMTSGHTFVWDGGDLTLTLHLRSADPGTPEIKIRSGRIAVKRVA